MGGWTDRGRSSISQALPKCPQQPGWAQGGLSVKPGARQSIRVCHKSLPPRYAISMKLASEEELRHACLKGHPQCCIKYPPLAVLSYCSFYKCFPNILGSLCVFLQSHLIILCMFLYFIKLVSSWPSSCEYFCLLKCQFLISICWVLLILIVFRYTHRSLPWPCWEEMYVSACWQVTGASQFKLL